MSNLWPNKANIKKSYLLIVLNSINLLFGMNKEITSLKFKGATYIISNNISYTQLDSDNAEYVSFLSDYKDDFAVAGKASIMGHASHLQDLITSQMNAMKTPQAREELKPVLVNFAKTAVLFDNNDALNTVCKYIDVNAPLDKNQNTLLVLAARNKENIDACKILIDRGANIYAQSQQPPCTLLMHAASANNIQLVKWLINPTHRLKTVVLTQSCDWDPVSGTPENDLSSGYSQPEFSGDKINKGVDKDELSEDQESTALTCAISSHATESALYLLKKGADVNKKGRWGQSPVKAAVLCHDNQIITKVLEKKPSLYPGLLLYIVNNTNGDLLQKICQNKIDLNLKEVKDENEETLLMHCARKKENFATGVFLVHHGVPLDDRNYVGRTALDIAVVNNNGAMIELLLKNNASPHIQNNFGRTPLSTAALYGYEHIVRYFMKRIALKDIIADRQEEAIFKGPSRTDCNKKEYKCTFDLLKKLFDKNSLVYYADATGAIPDKIQLISSLRYDDLNTFKELTNGSDLNEPLYHHGTTLLEAAICLQAKKNFDYLLSQHVSVNYTNASFQTTLHHAARYANSYFIQNLIDKGASIDDVSDYRHTPLVAALTAKNRQAVVTLINNNANLNMNSLKVHSHNLNILTYPELSSNCLKGITIQPNLDLPEDIVINAIQQSIFKKNQLKHIKFLCSKLSLPLTTEGKSNLSSALNHVAKGKELKLLLSNGADPSYTNWDRRSVFSKAVEQNNIQKIYVLLEYARSHNMLDQLLNSQCSQGYTPLIYAIDQRNKQLVSLLLKSGARVDIQDNNDCDALMHARLKGNREIEELIKQEIKKQMHEKWQSKTMK